jgi:hypothetical protein
VAAGDLVALEAMPQLSSLSISAEIRDDSVAKTYKGRSPFRRFTHLVDLDLGGIPIP